MKSIKRLSRRSLLRYVLATSIALAANQAIHAQTPVKTAMLQGRSHVVGHLIIKPKPGTSAANLSSVHRRVGARVDAKKLNGSTALVSYPENLTIEQAMKLYLDSGTVEYAEPDWVVHALVDPNDPLYPEQWALPKIGAPTAWNTQTSGRGVVVAVLDTGGGEHTDMQANRWRNAREIAGNRRDDDGNGYVDDVHGWDFVNNDGDPADDNNHGTHVGGIIAGTGNNRLGTSGVCWQGQVMHMKFLGASGSGRLSDALAAMRYAMDHGAKVINASYGHGMFSRSEMEMIEQLRQRGILLVCAAGNTPLATNEAPGFPAAYPMRNIISVAASTSNDGLASFSTFGPDVDLAAPGAGILSHLRGNLYGQLSGTSMATPYVAGAAALLWSRHPGEPWDRIANRLIHGVDPVSGLRGKVLSGGRLNVSRSLSMTTVPGFPADDYGDSFSNAAPRPVEYFNTSGYVYVGGLLDRPGDTDMFRLENPKPAAARLTIAATGSLSAQVYNSSGTLLGSEKDVTISVPSGTVYLRVTSPVNSLTPYCIGGLFLERQEDSAPKITLEGKNGTEIAPGDTTPSTSDGSDFGSHSIVDAPGITQAFTIRNSGNAVLNLQSPTIIGTNAGQFVLSTLPATSVAPGGSTVMVVTYRAAREGAASANVSITSNDRSRATYAFAVAGFGVIGPDDLPNDVPSVRDMAVTGTLNARLQYDRDNDVVRVYAPKAGTLEVLTSGTTNTYGYVYDGARSNHRLLAEDDNSNGGGNFKIRVKVDRGYYHIRVRGMGGVQGAYTLQSRFIP